MMHILVVDDDEIIREFLSELLKADGFTVKTARDGLQAMNVPASEKTDIIFLDMRLPGKGGMDVLNDIKNRWPEIEVIMMSSHSTPEVVVKSVKLGAWEFLEKPLKPSRVREIIDALMATKRNQNTATSPEFYMPDNMVGSSPQIRSINSMIDKSALSDSRVMILGENGTGKELVSRLIHTRSNRAAGPFVEVNCAAIPDSLLESELFGHEKGAFTGASSRHYGRFERASGGTLFLDEIADLSLSAQAKVLRAIQESVIVPVGSEIPVKVNVRIISATNKDLAGEVSRGLFREDLFFRLNVIPLWLPPLRDRSSDIPELLHYFSRNTERNDSLGKNISFSDKAMTVLEQYSWPGNVRELKNFVERVKILEEHDTVSMEMALSYLGETGETLSNLSMPTDYSGNTLQEARSKFEKKFIENSLAKNRFKISVTARELGMHPNSLHGKIKKYGIPTLK